MKTLDKLVKRVNGPGARLPGTSLKALADASDAAFTMFMATSRPPAEHSATVHALFRRLGPSERDTLRRKTQAQATTWGLNDMQPSTLCGKLWNHPVSAPGAMKAS